MRPFSSGRPATPHLRLVPASPVAAQAPGDTIRADDRGHVLGERPRLVLSSTANPKPGRHPSSTPTLTLERGQGRRAAPAEAPAHTPRFGISRATRTPNGQTIYFLLPVDSDGQSDVRGAAALVAEVRLYGVGELAHNEAITFLARLSEQLDDVGYEP